ncbi:Membrane-bound lytic murein transglycosylase F [Frankliniella fusca]|uniref:Membrane-bound lytic murein transglycosylase F n=1 Tax=Frankliniella fusca TaxID=407009 RepID=A0AAE1I3X5_9NEOP|nr:Membrane-bound lytic murein transglycosylase F [Frankliniella fusca]
MICPLCSATFNNLPALYLHLRLQHVPQNVDEFLPDVSTTSQDICINSSLNSSDSVQYDVKNFTSVVTTQVDTFVAKLYSKPQLPRNYVENIVQDVSLLFKNCLSSQFKNDLLVILKNAQVNSEELQHVENMFEVLDNSFQHLSSEYRRLKYFESNGLLVRPETVEIGSRTICKTTDKGTLRYTQKCHVQTIQLGVSLKHFLELPDAYDSIQSYISLLQSDASVSTAENFMQCPLWQQRRARYSLDQIVFPLFIYSDGVECNNPLGSHSKVLDAIYASLPCLPPECQSAIENIFLVHLYECSYRKDFTDEEIFGCVVSMLKSLEEEADNKAINSLGGFVEGFTANYFCRFCKTHRNDTHTQSVEISGSLRDEKSYSEDVAASDPKSTGVKFDCVLNALPSFHITSNYAVDIFHDLNEGFLIGDMVPKDYSYWLLYLKLRQVMDICFSKSVSASSSTSLRVLVEELNSMYVSVTKDTLKPKMHNLVHYSRVLEMSGPLSHLSCAKFETKHRSLTGPAHATTSRVDVSYTLALRHQLVQAFRFISNESILPKLQFGPGDILDLTSYDNYVSFRKSIPPSFRNQTLFSPKWINIKGTKYKPGMALLVNANENGPVFGKLKSILMKDSDIVFLFEYYLNAGFNQHLHAYAVGDTDIWSCKRPSELFDPLPLFAHKDVCDRQYPQIQSIRRDIVNHAAQVTHLTFGEILNLERRRIADRALRSVLTRRRLRPAMQRSRQMSFPTVPHTLLELATTLEDPAWASITQTLDLQDNIYFGSTLSADGAVSVLFMLKRCLEVLGTADILLADGTFYIALLRPLKGATR